jgi:stage V sporulation protein K
MKELLKENPGFESRIQFNIDFPDYTANELLEIFNELSKKEKYCISNNCREILLDHFNKVRSQKNFGNGRYVRNIFEKIKFEQADRVIRTNCKSMNRITKSDVQNALIQVQMKQENNCVRKMIGF